VGGELVLHDAEARGLLEIDDALHDGVPLDCLQVRVIDVQLVLEERVHLEQRVEVEEEVDERPEQIPGEEQNVEREEEAGVGGEEGGVRQVVGLHQRHGGARLLAHAEVEQTLPVHHVEEEDGERDGEEQRE